MSTFLLDANLAPKTAAFLRETFGLDVVHQRDVLPGSPSDEEVAAYAKREGRVIVTFDLGFAERYAQQGRGQLGIVVLRLQNHRRLAVEQVLARFFASDAPSIDLDTSLVIIQEHRVRVRQPFLS
jgi:predicted nuclease of predicted toxin-antitoxin system